jgi:hypothetical protein
MAKAHVHGVGRISAAVIGAPLAATLALLGLCALLPAGPDVRLLAFELGAVPAMVAGASAALLAASGRRAWLGSVAVAALAAIPLVFS